MLRGVDLGSSRAEDGDTASPEQSFDIILNANIEDVFVGYQIYIPGKVGFLLSCDWEQGCEVIDDGDSMFFEDERDGLFVFDISSLEDSIVRLGDSVVA